MKKKTKLVHPSYILSPIYTITCMVKKKGRNIIPAERVGCLGFFHHLGTAIDAVLTNERGLDCCIYTHCVVEQMLPGVHPINPDNKQLWFECDDNRNWKRIRRPTWSKGICNWAMG